MPQPLQNNAPGGYRFLPGIAPYSSGVIALPGSAIVHAVFATPPPWRDGMDQARRWVESLGRPQQALCGFELRCPQPHTMDGFIEFNRDYCQVLSDWEMLVDGKNPVARTNVAPVINPPKETVLHGFSYTVAAEDAAPSFVVAGGGELPHRDLDSQHILRAGETSEDAMLEKAQCVIDIMQHRLKGLGVEDRLATAIDVYTAYPLRGPLESVVIPGLPHAAQIGVQWFYTRPPIVDIEFEMDMRGVGNEIVVPC